MAKVMLREADIVSFILAKKKGRMIEEIEFDTAEKWGGICFIKMGKLGGFN